MAEESTSVQTLDEQLDSILHALGVRREVPSLDEQLDGVLLPLGVCRETSSDAASQPARAYEADGALRVHLHFLSVFCDSAAAPTLKERLAHLLRNETSIEADVLQIQGVSQHRHCNFMVVALAPFPPHLLEQLGTWEEVCACFGFTTALDLVSGGDDAEGAASG